MRGRCYLVGHGRWYHRDGFTTVPRGCTLTFYTQIAKTMLTSTVKQILKGTYTGEPSQIAKSCQLVPNHTLSVNSDIYRASRFKLDAREYRFTPGDVEGQYIFMSKTRTGLKLSEIFQLLQHEEYDYIWTCCRTIDLKDVGGKAFGVNAIETESRYGFNTPRTKIAYSWPKYFDKKDC